jgi:hypothetical protein
VHSEDFTLPPFHVVGGYSAFQLSSLEGQMPTVLTESTDGVLANVVDGRFTR